MLRRVAGCLSLGLRRVNIIAPASTTFTHLPPTISKPVHDWSSDANSDTKLPQACFNIFRVAGMVVGLSLSLGLGFKAHCSPGYTVDEATLKKYGRYPPWCRLNGPGAPALCQRHGCNLCRAWLNAREHQPAGAIPGEHIGFFGS